MPERETARVNLGHGQINLNGTTLNVNNIEFTQDAVNIMGNNDEVVAHLGVGDTFTATLDNAYFQGLGEFIENVENAPTADEFRRIVDEFSATPLTYTLTAEDLQAVTRTTSAHAYTVNPYQTYYNPHIINYDEMFFTEDKVCVAKVIEDDLPEKINHRLDKFLGEFAPKEAV